MITTKTTSKGNGISLAYNSNFTSETPLDYTDYQYEYGQGENGVRPTTAFPTSGQWSFGEKFQPGMTQVLFNNITLPYEPQRNQISQFYRQGYTWTNTLTLTSGGENGGFSLSVANLDNRTILQNSGYDWVQEALEEALDLSIYLSAKLIEIKKILEWGAHLNKNQFDLLSSYILQDDELWIHWRTAVVTALDWMYAEYNNTESDES
jgi:hypothetical protein